jgi:hypothetical protein
VHRLSLGWRLVAVLHGKNCELNGGKGDDNRECRTEGMMNNVISQLFSSSFFLFFQG